MHDGRGLDTERMAAFARWTNLSETTFLLPPTHPEADYRVRIFTPGGELPFAGHPTLGSCHVWLHAGGAPKRADTVVQECEIGLVPLRRGDRLAFAAPPTTSSAPTRSCCTASTPRSASTRRVCATRRGCPTASRSWPCSRTAPPRCWRSSPIMRR